MTRLNCEQVRAAGQEPGNFVRVCLKCRCRAEACKSIALHQAERQFNIMVLYSQVTHSRTGRTGELRFIGRYDHSRADWPCIIRYIRNGRPQDRASNSLAAFKPVNILNIH